MYQFYRQKYFRMSALKYALKGVSLIGFALQLFQCFNNSFTCTGYNLNNISARCFVIQTSYAASNIVNTYRISLYICVM